ncbi:CBS domain-containing protein [bacterium]|jgi:acetoin utilization protein AcuB|nr:CBS domain-containing protein [bacterium]MDB9701851.1 CBS domain-containing protein [Flavobacteriales bacterium]MDG1175869.1 CBS domain-containing protein [Flavobacteriales bacterium]|tara:strand:- start:3863 stop:4525 length:663 start_codon:yes stop_codon:yes gene_type:complete
MIASQLIVDLLPPIKPSESCQKAMLWMSEFKVAHLPVVSVNKYLGIITEEDLLDNNSQELSIAESKIHLSDIFVYEYQHIFEVMRIMSENNLTVIPILDVKENYIGATTLSHLMTLTANTTSIKEPGGVIVLSVNSKDYSLAQIAQIVESNNARILSSYVTSSDDTTEIEVTIKINKIELGAILQTFNRYDYTVINTFQRKDDFDDLQNRYDHLMDMLDL